MVTTPSKEAQAAEGAAREAAGNTVPPNERVIALEGTEGDPAARDPGAPVPVSTEPAEPGPRQAPVAKSLSDLKRDEINTRFRTRRSQATEDEKDDISEFARTAGLPPEFAALQAEPVALEAEPAAAEAEPAAPGVEAPAPASEPAKTVKIKVRGEEKEVAIDEALAMARKAYAAEDYLGEAKGKLDEVNTLLRETRDRATRSAQSGQPQAAPNGTQAADAPAPQVPQPQEDPFGKLIETMQFGDPEEARTLLRETIVQTAQQVARQTGVEDRLREDATKAAQVLADFRDQHKELAEDPMANAAIESKIYQLQADDLKALNVDLARLRQDGLPATPADIANVHQRARAAGHRVRSAAQMLEDATKSFLEWRGVAPPLTADPAPPQPQPALAAQRAKPVEVIVDRAARKSAIPQQPSRTTAPRSEPQQAAPLSRSAVVARMKQTRAVKRGTNLGLGQGG